MLHHAVPYGCLCEWVCVCVFLGAVHVQGAIPLTSGGWPPKRPLVRAVNVPAQTHRLQ